MRTPGVGERVTHLQPPPHKVYNIYNFSCVKINIRLVPVISAVDLNNMGQHERAILLGEVLRRYRMTIVGCSQVLFGSINGSGGWNGDICWSDGL